jgi:hypothetical protein
MMNFIKFISFFMVFISIPSFSADLFILKNQNVTAIEKKAITQYFNKVSDLTPQIIKDSLPSPIEVSFENFKESTHLAFLPEYNCELSTNLRYAITNKLKTNQIIINKLLLFEIIKGEENAKTFNCRHKNYYRLALATLLHETSHIYDHLNFGTTKISGQKSFFKLADWKRNLLYLGSSKNMSQNRSVDPYEFKNLSENFAVNFEYFILDPEYKCKRPTYYRYYQTQFKTSPHADAHCKVYTEVRLDDTKVMADIAPDRVYRVDYLLASKGDEAISGFGHSMYRLIVCAPFRKKASAECLKDKLYHVVLSYRANVTDIKSNPIKGLIGNYDSVLFMLSFPKVIEEYNTSELRDLYSLPLNFSEDQKERFIHKALETYWEYAGSYKFLTSNCASESNELLQSALNDHPIINETVVKPYSLMNELVEYGLADKDIYKDPEAARKKGYLFESDSRRLAEIKQRLFGDEDSDFEIIKIAKTAKNSTNKNVDQKIKKHIKDILQKMPPVRFQEMLDEFSSREESLETKELLTDLSIITQATLAVLHHDLDEEIGSYLESLEKDPGELGQYIRNWNEKRKLFRLSPLRKDYGIPLTLTDEDFETYKTQILSLEKTEEDLVKNVKNRYLKEVEDLKLLQRVIEIARTKSKIIGVKHYFDLQ